MNRSKAIEKMKSMGFNIFPLRPMAKEPMTDKWKRLQTEKYDGPFPESCNIGVICGAISNNLYVIDLDDDSLFNDFKEYHDRTFIVKTGRGYHIYFRSPGFCPPNKKFDDVRGRHIDCKSEGGYILGFTSIHPDTKTEYSILYDQPVMIVNPQEIKDKLIALGFNAQGKTMDEIEQGVEEGSRDDSMFKLACHLMRKEQLYGAPLEDKMFEVNKRNKPPLNESDILRIIKQAQKYEGKSIKPIKDIILIDENEKKDDDDPIILTMQEIDPVKHEGVVIQFDARVMAVGEFQTYTVEATFECTECDRFQHLYCDDYHMIDEPVCKHGKMKPNLSTKKTAYIQPMRIQEFLELSRNNTPREYDAEITNKNVGMAFMNDRMTFTAKFRSLPPKKAGEYNHIVFDIISMKPLEQHEGCMPTQEEIDRWLQHNNIYKYVVDSIAPELFIEDELIETGMFVITGGTALNDKRALIHGAYIGDGQLGKSEMIKALLKLIPGSGLSVGRQATGPGLTIGWHTMYNGMKVPMAGFLPSHTGKPVGIDEGDKMKTEDLESIYECMEQQTASNNKTGAGAGIQLPTVCPVLFGANPKNGKYNPKTPNIMDNFNFSAPFLSRFDIIWLLVDKNDPDHDDRAIEHIRNYEANKDKYMKLDELQRYFTYARTIKVTMSKEFQCKIDELYKKMRPLNKLDGIPIGLRQYYGLNRLITACAALHLRDYVTQEDFDIVYNVINKSLLSLKMNMETGKAEIPLNKESTKKDEIFLETWTELQDEDKTVDKDEMIEKLSKHSKFVKVINGGEKEWNKYINMGQLEQLESSRWRMVSK